MVRGEGTTAAATALVVLTTGFSTRTTCWSPGWSTPRVGVAVGLAVNFVVGRRCDGVRRSARWTPSTTGSAQLLVDMGDGLVRDAARRGPSTRWVDADPRRSTSELDRTWALVRQASESARLNPRRPAREFRDPQVWVALLHDLEQAIAESLSICHTVRLATRVGEPWHAEFRDALRPGALRERAARSRRPTATGCVAAATGSTSSSRSAGGASPPALWPVYGALVVNLRNILDAMDEVAGTNPLHQPPLPFATSRPAAPPVDRGTAP